MPNVAQPPVPRFTAISRIFTGKPVSKGYIHDRVSGRIVWSCPHQHRYPGGHLRAQACAEKQLRTMEQP